MEELDVAGELVETGGQLYRKIRPKPGRIRNTLWDDINETLGNEDTGYPTQKPLPLYERIVLASSNPGDMVLDPFCGCATTPIAAERQGRQWVGMDIWDGAHRQVIQRMQANQQLVAYPNPVIHLETAAPPPPERMAENPLRSRSERPRAAPCAIPRLEPSTTSYWLTLDRYAKVVGQITVLILASWKLTISTPVPKAGRTLTRT